MSSRVRPIPADPEGVLLPPLLEPMACTSAPPPPMLPCDSIPGGPATKDTDACVVGELAPPIAEDRARERSNDEVPAPTASMGGTLHQR